MRLSVCVVDLCQDSSNPRARHGSSGFKPVAVGRNAGEHVGAESSDVGLDAAIVGRAAAAGTSDCVGVLEVGYGHHILPLFLTSGDVAPSCPRAVLAVGCSRVSGRKDVHKVIVLYDVLIHLLGKGSVAGIAPVGVAARGNSHSK